jgi:hypothetical protein
MEELAGDEHSVSLAGQYHQVEWGKNAPWCLNLEALGESERFKIPRGLVSFVLPTDIDEESAEIE